MNRKKTVLKIVLGALVLICSTAIVYAVFLRSQKKSEDASNFVKPTFQDVKYGPHDKNVLDFYQSELPGPRPVVIYIHGGGWANLNRHTINSVLDVEDLVDKGISVVSVDYRFIFEGERQGLTAPVQLPMEDAKRVVQFVRSKRKEWNIDSDRIAGVGGSAGACSVLWLAFHDDMARAADPDVVSRESTRLQFAFTVSAQTTLDPAVMRDWIPNIAYGQNAFGFRSSYLGKDAEFERFHAARNKGEYPKLIKEYSPISHLTLDDPPTWNFYDGVTMPAKGEIQADPTHSCLFGAILLDEAKKLGRSGDTVLFTEDVRKLRSTLTNLVIETLIGPSVSFSSIPDQPRGRSLVAIRL